MECILGTNEVTLYINRNKKGEAEILSLLCCVHIFEECFRSCVTLNRDYLMLIFNLFVYVYTI